MNRPMILAGTLAVWLAAGRLAAGTDAEAVPSLTVPRFSPGTSMTLDGKLNEAAWQRAARIDGYQALGQEPRQPSQQTEVRAFYDATSLYLGFVFHESEMGKLIPGLPAGQTVDTPITSNADCGEIMLDLAGEGRRYLHLRFNPRGGKFDALRTQSATDARTFAMDDRWDGDWLVATATDAKAWTAEVRIPFAALGEEDRLGGTPVKDTVWRANFCRSEAPHAEFSGWSRTTGTFHEPPRFGRLVFGGREGGEITLAQGTVGLLELGTNTFSGCLRNDTAKDARVQVKGYLIGESRAAGDGPVSVYAGALDLPPGIQTNFSFPFVLQKDGAKAIAVRLDWKDVEPDVYVGQIKARVNSWRTRLAQGAQDLGDLAERAQALQPAPADGSLPRFLESVAVCRRKISAIQEDTARPWPERAAQADAAVAEAEALKRVFGNDVYARHWAARRGLAEPAFVVGVEHPTRKVFRDDVFGGALVETAHLAMAANEYESAQLVIIPLKEGLGEVRCTVSDLVHQGDAKRVIGAAACWFDVVGYLDVGDTGHGTRVGAWPDVLYPDRKVTVQERRLQPVMLTIKTERETPPGIYRGKVKFESDGRPPVEQPLAVEVYPFALPKVKTMRTNIWFWTFRPAMFYALPAGKPFPIEMFRQAAELLGRYHIAPAPRGDILSRQIVLRRDAKGQVTFDFSRMDPYWETAVANGATVLNVDELGPAFFEAPKKEWNPHAHLIDPVTGKEENYLADDPRKMSDQYLVAVCNHFKEKGWFDRAIYLSGDEPWGAKAQAALRETYTRVKSLVPDLPVTAAGTVPLFANLDGYLDIWCPQFPQYEPKDYRGSKEGLWFYQCLYKPNYPMFMIDRPGIEPRMAFWLCWKAGATGFLYWTSTAWDDDKIRGKKLSGNGGKDRWINEHWLFPMPSMPGDGCFIYPQPDRLVATFRTQAMRDGVEDYEYFVILKRLRQEAHARRKLAPELAKEVDACLKLPEDVVASNTNWTRSVERLSEMRALAARLIGQLQGLLKESSRVP